MDRNNKKPQSGQAAFYQALVNPGGDGGGAGKTKRKRAGDELVLRLPERAVEGLDDRQGNRLKRGPGHERVRRRIQGSGCGGGTGDGSESETSWWRVHDSESDEACEGQDQDQSDQRPGGEGEGAVSGAD
ncbi:unnamed protein product [Symbiodinium natans]|uniref:Uncharacterized protein n=1 Tax=Symbiodinium natans TaxID=878477 RepID=A0A812VEN7_9DINO|nr:unnamed protein product [Symbiodinium natans]